MNYQIQTDVSLKPYNTFAIDVKARMFVRVKDLSALREILKDPRIHGQEILILGGGSNLLLTRDVEGVVLHIDFGEITLLEDNESYVIVKAGSGVNWHEFVLYTVERGWGGLENLSFIPGDVGGAPVQNIGAYGVEIKETLMEVEAVKIDTGEVKVFTNAECKFDYRDSIFKHEAKGKYIIISSTFKLQKPPHVLNTSYGAVEEELVKTGKSKEDWTIQDVSDVVTHIRRTKLPDPAEIGTAGSFFKNPIVSRMILEKLQNSYPDIPFFEVDETYVKIPAGWLIDKAGWKGWHDEKERYGVHKLHALVLVNYKDATGKEILQLAKDIQEDIEQKFGIRIEPEVNVY